MSTVITYKGSSLASFSNEIRVLATKGKWVENGIVIENVSSGGGTPSATAHTILFDFEDETTATITAYYDSAFISDAIRATTPTTYGGKTVQQASLDGVAWYIKPTETWETVYDANCQFNEDSDADHPYCWIMELANIYPVEGTVWRVTFDGTEYICNGKLVDNTPTIGNPLYTMNGVDDGSGIPIGLYNAGWGAWSGAIDKPNENASYPLKIERQVIV